MAEDFRYRGNEPESIPELQGWILVTLAAEILGVARQTVHQMAHRGVIDARWVRGIAPGGVVIVSEEDVRKLAGLRGSIVPVLDEEPLASLAVA